LSQVDLSVPEIIDILAGLKLNMPNYETDKLNELIYMAKTQHVMANIGNVIQNEPMLKNISIGANYKQVPNDLKRFTDKHKLNLDESSERLKFIIKELGLVLDEYCLPEEVRA